MNTLPPEERDPQASRGIRQAHPERVGQPGQAKHDLAAPEPATPVHGEPVEPPPHASALVHGEPIEPQPRPATIAHGKSVGPSPQPASPVRGEPVESPATTFEHLHPYARWGMRLTTLLLLAGPTLIPSAVLLVAWDGAPAGLRFALWIGIFVAVLVAGWTLGSLRYARTGFALDAAGLRIRRGLWWRSETLVPRSRVQHTDVNHGPLDRRLGLATLRVHTAGTRLASVALDGLPEKRALELRDALVATEHDVL